MDKCVVGLPQKCYVYHSVTRGLVTEGLGPGLGRRQESGD